MEAQQRQVFLKLLSVGTGHLLARKLLHMWHRSLEDQVVHFNVIQKLIDRLVAKSPATVDDQTDSRYPQGRLPYRLLGFPALLGEESLADCKRIPSSTPATCNNSQSSGKSLQWTDLGARLVAEFQAKLCSPYMFVDVSPSFGLDTAGRVPESEEGRVPDGVVSPSSGPDLQGLLYVTLPPLVSALFRQFNSFVQQTNRHTRVADLLGPLKRQRPAHPTTQNPTQTDEQHPVPGLLHPAQHRASSVFNKIEIF